MASHFEFNLSFPHGADGTQNKQEKNNEQK
jgi:hypothetical protein